MYTCYYKQEKLDLQTGCSIIILSEISSKGKIMKKRAIALYIDEIAPCPGGCYYDKV